jgi:hypothetical protein
VKIAYQDLEYFRALHDNWYDDRSIFPILVLNHFAWEQIVLHQSIIADAYPKLSKFLEIEISKCFRPKFKFWRESPREQFIFIGKLF